MRPVAIVYDVDDVLAMCEAWSWAEGWLRFLPSSPGDAVEVRDLLAQSLAAIGEDPEDTWVSGPHGIASSPFFRSYQVRSEAGVRSWLAALDAAANTRNVSGRLRPVYPKVFRTSAPVGGQLTIYVALDTYRTSPRRSMVQGGTDLTTAAREALLGLVQGGTEPGNGPDAGSSKAGPDAADDDADYVLWAVPDRPATTLRADVAESLVQVDSVLWGSYQSAGSDRSNQPVWRQGAVSWGGLTELIEAHVGDDWAGKVARSRNTLRTLAPVTRVGFAQIGPGTCEGSWSSLIRDVLTDSDLVSRLRTDPALLQNGVPRAAGLLLLTGAHLGRLPSGPQWLVEEVAPDRFLVEHVELAQRLASAAAGQANPAFDLGDLLLPPGRDLTSIVFPTC